MCLINRNHKEIQLGLRKMANWTHEKIHYSIPVEFKIFKNKRSVKFCFKRKIMFNFFLKRDKLRVVQTKIFLNINVSIADFMKIFSMKYFKEINKDILAS